jgi:thiosulfate/3-mercaptopyruvate sulfurtransferase
VVKNKSVHDRPLISTGELSPRLETYAWAIVDCRFYLAETDRGESEYVESHIPGAVYAHLDRDLSAIKTGTNGRHPLPSVGEMSKRFSAWGIDSDVRVVAYDADAGQIAARLWWMLRYLGHDHVAVLNGGFKAWKQAGLPVRGGREERRPRSFEPRVRDFMRVDVDELMKPRRRQGRLLIDARDPERYRGEQEPIDPVAGHIPGARNRPWQDNLDERGLFRPPETLRSQFEALLGDTPPDAAVVYCGSGVTACHDLLAMEHAGILGPRLYPGSWSEWCADPARPIETGV